MRELPWGEVSYQLVETGFVDWPERDRTVESIHRVTSKMSEDELGTLLSRIGIVFAPGGGRKESIKPFPSSPEPFQKGKVMVYFPPEIESGAEQVVDLIVATEFARILLGQYGPNAMPSVSANEAIRAKIQKWGVVAGGT